MRARAATSSSKISIFASSIAACSVSSRPLMPKSRMVIAAVLAVHANLAHHLRELIVVGEQRAAVAVAAERLRGKERRRADFATARTNACPRTARRSSARASSITGSRCLRAMALMRVEVGALTVQRHRHDRLGARRDRALDQRRIDVVRARDRCRRTPASRPRARSFRRWR